MSRLVNRNVNIGEHRTSMRLEPEVWDALADICSREKKKLIDVITESCSATDEGGRTSAVRMYVLRYYQQASTEEGHIAAGHGVKEFA